MIPKITASYNVFLPMRAGQEVGVCLSRAISMRLHGPIAFALRILLLVDCYTTLPLCLEIDGKYMGKYAELSNCIRITSQCDWSRLSISPNKSPITHRTSPILRRKYTIMSYNYSRTRTKQACSLCHDLIISAYVCVTTEKIICLAGNAT